MPSPAPLRRTRYIAREAPFGRETLRRRARELGVLLGWEAVTLRALAQELAWPALAAAGVAVAPDLQLAAIADEALDALLAARKLPPVLAQLATTLGVRTAVWDAIGQLRVAGVTPTQLEAAARPGSAAAAMVPVLAAYERLLADRHLADPAAVFHAAIGALSASTAPFADRLLIEPGAAEVSGLPATFVDALAARGAERELAGAAEPGLTAAGAALSIMRAATPMDEVRHALRTALQEGLRWDEVELAATDADTYGVALATLGARLGIPFTIKEGVPLARSRVGAALERWLAWLAGGLPVSALRAILEHGDLAIDGLVQDVSVAAGTLRAARAGWGRARWEEALGRFDNGSWAESVRWSREVELPAPDEDARRAELRARAKDAAVALRAVLDITPPVPEPGDAASKVTTGVPDLARAIGRWLERFGPTATSDDERATVTRLRDRLSALADDAPPVPVPFAAALATLKQALADLRAFPSIGGDRAPRTSLPGHVHLTDVTHAGVTGRRRVFVLGMDADRTVGARIPDPILDDTTRAQLGDALPTTTRRAARRDLLIGRALASLAARAAGDAATRVTLSYATAADGVGREASPSAWLLDAARAREGNPHLTYDEFRRSLGPPACAVPGTGQHALDARDAWLGALASGEVTLDGVAAVDEAFPALARGFGLVEARAAGTAGEWHGLVPDAAGRLGPLASPERAISPTSLEQLAACPLKWFYERGLGLRDPGDVEFDAGLWLDAAQRGSLLHEAFEQFVSQWKRRTGDLGGAEAMTAAREVLSQLAVQWRAEIPPPSAFVFEREMRTLDALMVGFLVAEREDFESGRTRAWREVERAFPGRGAPVRFDLGGGDAIRIHGRIDRIDEARDGSLRAVDYKTGSSFKYRRDSMVSPTDGGRRLQPALYAAAAAQLLASPVGGFEYRFPKERAPRHRVEWTEAELARAQPVVRSLLTHPGDGHFVPTDDTDDCRYCAFGTVCRVTTSEWEVDSPRAAWSKAHGATSPEFVELRRRRDGEVG